jgi:PilZ domain
MNEVIDRCEQVERRQSSRYPLEVDNVHVGWWDGPEFRSEPAKTEDLSAGGVRLRLSGLVVPSEKVWVRFAVAPASEWLPGRVVDTVREGDSHGCIRVELSNGCPYDVLKALTWGASTTSGQASSRARSFRLASDSLSFRVAREDNSPYPHKSFRLTSGALGGRRPARPSSLSSDSEPPTNGSVSAAISRPAEFSEPLLPLPAEPPPIAEVSDAIRQAPVSLTESRRLRRREQNRVKLLASGVRIAASISIAAVLWVTLTQEYGKIQPLVVIYETISE